MVPTPIVIVTGHPASGKTTLAHFLARQLHLPLIYKDEIKETLFDVLGWSTLAWNRKLSMVTWTLLYQQVEALLRAGVPHVVEGNFTPVYSNETWQRIVQQYPVRLIQVRCEPDAETLLARYRQRIVRRERHPGHMDQSDDQVFTRMVRQGPLDWIAVTSERVSVDTAALAVADYDAVAAHVRRHVEGA